MVWYNCRMDKLAYHLNKKKQPAPTDGKFLYYYPADEEIANAHVGNKYYITIEVSEQEWETLIEMDRLEYNNTHTYQRHNTVLPDRDTEALLSPKEQEQFIDKNFSFAEAEKKSPKALRHTDDLTDREFEVYNLCVIEDKTQAEAAEELGLTQGYISMTLKKAKEKVTNAELKKASPEAYVRKCWDIFLDTGTMPDYLDVELEFVIRWLLLDLLPFTHWYYSVGEFCRYLMTYYLFDEDKIDEDIAKYKEASDEEERLHFEEYYGERPPIVQAVYVRLMTEMNRRQQSGLHDSDKAYTSIYSTAEKIASRLKISTYDFLTQRFYPFFAKSRNKRIEQFYKAYSGKKLLK